MKQRLVFLLLAAVLLIAGLTVTAGAAELVGGACSDSISWSLTDDGTLTITGTGELPYYSNGSAPWYPYRGMIQKAIIGEGVTVAGGYLFYESISLTEVSLPASLTKIAFYAFDGCTSLQSITVAAGNANYVSDGGILFNKAKTELIRYPAGKTAAQYTVPGTVTKIASSAFENAKTLTSVTLHDNVTEIGSSAFENCSSLQAFAVPAGVTKIQTRTFYDCTALTSITLPEGLTTIGGGAFYGCKALASITLPEGLTTIGDGAFGDCKMLASITLPESLTTIGSQPFFGCETLTSLHFPKNVSNISNNIFYGYPANLTSVTVDAANTNYASVDGVLFNKDKTMLIYYPPKKAGVAYTVPDGVKLISEYAFYFCEHLKNVTLPQSLLSIGDGTFSSGKLDYVLVLSKTVAFGDGVFPPMVDSLGTPYPNRDFTLYGYSGSTAETYAAANSIPFYALDDFKIVTPAANATYSVGQTAAPLTVKVEPNLDTVTYAWYAPDSNGLYTMLVSTSPTYTPDTSVAGTYRYAVMVTLNVAGKAYTAQQTDITVTVTDVTSGKCGNNLTWTLQNGVLTITGSGAMDNYTAGNAPWYAARAQITTVVLPTNITSIGAYAFEGCSALTALTIPASVTTFGANAFSGCTALTLTVHTDAAAAYAAANQIPYKKTSDFRWTTTFGGAMTNNVFGNIAVTTITGTGKMPDYSAAEPAPWKQQGGNNFFLTGVANHISLADTITSVGAYAFDGFTSLNIYLPKSITAIHAQAFINSQKISIFGHSGSAAETYAKQNSLVFIDVDASINANVSAKNLAYSLGSAADPLTLIALPGTGSLTCTWYMQVNGSIVKCTDKSGQDRLTVSCPVSTENPGTILYWAEILWTRTLADGTLYHKTYQTDAITVYVTKPAGKIAASTYDKVSAWFHTSLQDVAAAGTIELVLKDANGGLLTTMTRTAEPLPSTPAPAPAPMPDYLIDNNAVRWAFNGFTGQWFIEVSTGVYAPTSEYYTRYRTWPKDALGFDSSGKQVGNYIFDASTRTWAAESTGSTLSYITDQQGAVWTLSTSGWVFRAAGSGVLRPADQHISFSSTLSTGTGYDKDGNVLGLYTFDASTLSWKVRTETIHCFGPCILPATPSALNDNNGILWVYAADQGWTFTIDNQTTYAPSQYMTIVGKPLPTTASTGTALYTYDSTTSTWVLTSAAASQSPLYSVLGDPRLYTEETVVCFLYANGKIDDGWTQTAWTPSAARVPTTLTLIIDGRTVATHTLTLTAADWAAALGQGGGSFTPAISNTAGATVTPPINGWVVGANTFTVKADAACAVAISHDGGLTCQRLPVTPNGAGGYSCTATGMTASSVLTVVKLGDLNGDGKLTNADITQLRAAVAGRLKLSTTAMLAADVNGSGTLTNADITSLRAAIAGKVNLGWN